jgi:hypothetical protein
VHPLTQLRSAYQQTEARIDALHQANEARREQAQEVRAEMEAEALVGNTEAMRARMDDLAAINQAFESNRIAQAKLQDERAHMGDQIKGFYRDCVDGHAEVDWTCRLDKRDKVLRSDWGGPTYHDGRVCLIDVELCEPELCALREVLGTRRVYQEGDRLRVMYSQYRNLCWGDADGGQIIKSLALILDKRRSPVIEMTQFVERLAVLA